MQLKYIIVKETPDIIIAHGGRATKFAHKAKNKVPIVGITHSGKLKGVDKSDYIICLTNAMRKVAIESGIDSKRVTVIPNAIDLDLYKNRVEKELSSVPVIGTMARFVYKKGIDTFLESLSLLKKEGVQFKAVIGGSGEEEEAYKNLSNKLGLDHYVEFTGWVKDKKQFFDSLDIFCLPSHNEPFGIILLEAMAYKMPVVSTLTDGPSEILHNERDGLLVAVSSAEEMAEAIKRLLDDELLAKKLGSQAFLTVKEKYDTRVVGNILSSYLHEIKNNHDIKHH